HGRTARAGSADERSPARRRDLPPRPARSRGRARRAARAEREGGAGAGVPAAFGARGGKRRAATRQPARRPRPRSGVPRGRAAVGLEEAGFPLDELFWGTRKFFELVATERPLVVAFEDIHWAEQAFLDLIDHVATTSTGAPLLIMCATRPDLFEHRADWRHHHE